MDPIQFLCARSVWHRLNATLIEWKQMNRALNMLTKTLIWAWLRHCQRLASFKVKHRKIFLTSMTNRIKNFYLQLSLNWNIFARNLQRFKRLQWYISRTFWRFRWPWLAIWIYRFHLPTRKNLYTKNTQSHAILLLRSHIVLSMLLYQNLNYAIFSAKTYSATIDHSVRLVNSIF